MSDSKVALLMMGLTNICKVAGICYLVYLDYPWFGLLFLGVGFNWKSRPTEGLKDDN